MERYNNRTHIYGRFWVITALVGFIMIPLAISAHLDAWPSASAVFKGLAPIALRTFGHAEDVAWAMAFLASDYARYITGTCLEISGGKMGVQNPSKAWQDKETRG